MESRLFRVRTQGPGLAKGEIGRTRHALLFSGTVRVLHAPGIKPGERTPRLGKHPVGVGVLNEARIARETAEILFPKGFFGKRGYRLNRRIVSEPVADHRPDKAPPIS